jgi:hypothetical protein
VISGRDVGERACRLCFEQIISTYFSLVTVVLSYLLSAGRENVSTTDVFKMPVN